MEILQAISFLLLRRIQGKNYNQMEVYPNKVSRMTKDFFFFIANMLIKMNVWEIIIQAMPKLSFY